MPNGNTMGELRSTLMGEVDDEARRHLWELLRTSYERDPRAHEEQWIPYVARHWSRWDAHTLTCVDSVDELRAAALVAPFASFFWSNTRRMTRAEAQELVDDPILSFVAGFSPGHDHMGADALSLILSSTHLADTRWLFLEGSLVDDDALEHVLSARLSRSLESLAVGHQPLPAWFFERMQTPNLTYLYVAGAQLDETHTHALAQNASLAMLETLVARNNPIEPGGALALAKSPHLRRLKRLELDRCSLGDEGAERLLASPILETVVDLRLIGNRLGARAMRALASSDHLESLDRLRLEDNLIGPEGAAALAEAPGLRGVTMLYLDGNGISDDGIRALASSDHLDSLVSFHLDDNGIGPTGARALAESNILDFTTRLRIASNPLGAEGITALAQTECLAALFVLHATETEMGDAGFRALTRSSALDALTSLEVRRCGISARGLDAFVTTKTTWVDLETIDVSENALDALFLEHLSRWPGLARMDSVSIAKWHSLPEDVVIEAARVHVPDGIARELFSSWWTYSDETLLDVYVENALSPRDATSLVDEMRSRPDLAALLDA